MDKMTSMIYLVAALSCFYVASGVRNGELVYINHFKYVVGILSGRISLDKLCTGGIIHERYVLTAAHCFSTGTPRTYEKRIVRVYAGRSDLLKPPLGEEGKEVKASHVYIMKKYFEDGIDDIAILKLDEALDLNKYKKLDLPTATNYAKRFHSYETAGYGSDPRDHWYSRKKPDGVLKKVNSLVLDANKACANRPNLAPFIEGLKRLCIVSRKKPSLEPDLRRKLELTSEEFDPSVLVDSKRPLGLCGGDSGAPIVKHDEFLVVGVVSLVPKECDSRAARDLHINASVYVDSFIQPVLAGHNNGHLYQEHETKHEMHQSCQK